MQLFSYLFACPRLRSQVNWVVLNQPLNKQSQRLTINKVLKAPFIPLSEALNGRLFMLFCILFSSCILIHFLDFTHMVENVFGYPAEFSHSLNYCIKMKYNNFPSSRVVVEVSFGSPQPCSQGPLLMSPGVRETYVQDRSC